MVSRRFLLLLAGTLLSTIDVCAAAEDRDDAYIHALARLEREHGGTLGVAILDSAKAATVAYRGDQRFPLCSTYKLIAAAAVLARVDRGDERLDRRVAYSMNDLVAYSPATAPHAGTDGMTVGELCAAALTLSDNTAANLLLDSMGGPASLTTFVRTLGDDVTRFDRHEPELNDWTPGEQRDTTTPLAMTALMRTLFLERALSYRSRAQLAEWTVACRTGDTRLRAGVPSGWRVGDKTGTADRGITNDVAVIWPPGRAPVLVAAYYVGSTAPGAEREAALATVGHLASTI